MGTKTLGKFAGALCLHRRSQVRTCVVHRCANPKWWVGRLVRLCLAKTSQNLKCLTNHMITTTIGISAISPQFRMQISSSKAAGALWSLDCYIHVPHKHLKSLSPSRPALLGTSCHFTKLSRKGHLSLRKA